MWAAVLTAWDAVREPVKSIIPDPIRKRRFNFISIHYMYLISMAIAGSVIMFRSGGLHYIDSIFFASGAATQSGLNTVDVNKITTSQQVVLYLLGMTCNPIFIHSFVVFVRLYWFERRFQHVVREARSLRRSKSRSRNNTLANDDPEGRREDAGVRGRSIVVMHNNGDALPVGANGTNGLRSETQREKVDPDANTDSVTSSANTKRDSAESAEEPANGVSSQHEAAAPDEVRLPQQMSAEQHIAFLENQRHPKDRAALRIPSPREFDRGGVPQALENEEDVDGGLGHVNSDLAAKVDSAQAGPQMRNHITIDEPAMRPRTKTATVPRLNTSAASETARRQGPHSALSRVKSRQGTFGSFRRSDNDTPKDPMPYLSWEPTIGRNSMFVDLTEQQREELGGIEYRALKTLALILVTYFFAFHVLGVICLVPWIMHSKTYGPIVTGDGQGRVWWGLFTASSAFNDLGFTLTPDSMISFGTAIFPLLLMTFLIVIGNTGFPCMLRFVIWLCSISVPRGSGIWEELQFLLDHPRRCFTLLFPRGATWWLFTILVVLNGMDLIFYIILDLHDSTVTAVPPGYRVLNGLFQAASTRTAGFSVVNLADLHPAIQVSYLIMMYISVFPIAISMRRTNVYEEKSLGIYVSPGEEEEDSKEPSYIGAHLRNQLSFDLWYIFLGLFVIAIVEGSRLQQDSQTAFTLFTCLFEIVSAYGTVGLSLGYPTVNASFSSQFQVLSKLVIIAMQIRGRHRGLPYELDRAILLPSESLHKKEMADAEKRMRRRGSTLSEMSAVAGTAQNADFRAETGLSTATPFGQHLGRPRTNTGGSGGTHASHVRSGLGTAMFKLSTHPEVPSRDDEVHE